jgi:hypothetical protein
LQNHLRRYLIDIAASRARFLSCFSQRPVGCHRRQPFIPSDDRARQICAKLFYELKRFGRGSTDRAFHLAGNPHHDMIYLSFANNLRNSPCGPIIGRDRLERMRQQQQLIGDRRSDARPAKIDS